jgi:phosphatidylserine/phosphatidylglycerophosphate/cardiolipin synthase-like enzyme
MGRVLYSSILGVLGVTIPAVGLVLLLLFQSKKQRQLSFTNVFFFPDKSDSTTLFDIIKSSKNSLDICVYCLTGYKFLDAIKEAHSNGVIVRIVTDHEEDNLSHILTLRSNGIQVRTNPSGYLMHHKFAVIDEHAILTGSLNWTSKAINGNQENVIFTNNRDIVNPFARQFEKLWDIYTPSP